MAVPDERRVMTRVYLRLGELSDLDALAEELGVSRSHAVAALVYRALL